ncbi:HDOD domain-containing protein [Thiorhodococcus mannitoliphagus]|uniref:HDOD domain-containing protein n=1 Tax=Thiorhodococcus mannitoliphagus TaxID=329406 RepID=A0A6P1DUC2_9GAMM|nr:HDOD domain-containing protein [Thiorhodococcus mannitoliphagus]NEX21369.1 HDOD domain-containing protein [Thiorhodococcus mannitoliphagus]
MTPEALVNQTDTLLSFPDVALRLNRLIDEPATRPSDLAEVIICDPGLSARLLRLVNSALYARPQPVATVSQAIGLIGYRALRELVIATCTVDMFKGLSRQQVDMERFWLHGIACAIAVRHLAGHCGPHDGERLFLAGLLHSLGKLIFFTQCADAYAEVLRLVEQDGLAVDKAEQRVFGFDYADLGAELLKHWDFPESIWSPVAHHLDPAKAAEHRIEAEILHAAARIAQIVQVAVLADSVVPTEDNCEALCKLAERLGMEPDALIDLPGAINLQILEVFEILVPGSTLVY